MKISGEGEQDHREGGGGEGRGDDMHTERQIYTHIDWDTHRETRYIHTPHTHIHTDKLSHTDTQTDTQPRRHAIHAHTYTGTHTCTQTCYRHTRRERQTTYIYI